MNKFMRKIKITSIILLIVSVAIFGAYVIYEKNTSDNVSPEIMFESELLKINAADGEEVILADVTAMDDKSGDVTDTLVVEKMATLGKNNTREIVYAAIDDEGNVARRKRVVQYEDYESPKYKLTKPLRYPSGKAFDVLECVEANSVLDGDLTDDVNYTLSNLVDLMTPGFYAVEFSVTDSAGVTEYLLMELEVYDRLSESIEVNLSEYLVYVERYATFSPEKYYMGASEEGVLSIRSNVNIAKPGVYSVDYTVENAYQMGKTRLVVVVME